MRRPLGSEPRVAAPVLRCVPVRVLTQLLDTGIIGVGAISDLRREFPHRRDPAVKGPEANNEHGEPSPGFPGSPGLLPRRQGKPGDDLLLMGD